jgi:ATP-binding cassette subfamily F protein uup
VAIVRLNDISLTFGDVPVFTHVDFSVEAGERICLIGRNAAGKTTLLRILLGEITPQQGTVKFDTGIQVGYFGQPRETLDPEKTVAQVVGNGYDYVRLHGRDVHVIGYLQGFFSTPAAP